jgi:hypothetical protein
MYLARFLRRAALGLFWVTSAYLTLMLLITLSNEGEPTGMVSATSMSQFFYPAWYANPDFISAVKFAVIGYPAAAMIFGLGSILRHSLADRPIPPRTYAPSGLAEMAFPGGHGGHVPFLPKARPEPADALQLSTLAPTAHLGHPDDLCILDGALAIRSIGRNAADLLGAPAETLIRRSFTTFLGPADLPFLHAAAAVLRGDPHKTFTLTLELRHLDHSAVAAEAVCHGGLGPDGEVMSLALRPRPIRGPFEDQLAAIWY